MNDWQQEVNDARERLGIEEQPSAPVAAVDTEGFSVPCEVYTRVVGYYRPVSAFNIGKQQEHRERVPFRVPAARAYYTDIGGRVARERGNKYGRKRVLHKTSGRGRPSSG